MSLSSAERGRRFVEVVTWRRSPRVVREVTVDLRVAIPMSDAIALMEQTSRADEQIAGPRIVLGCGEDALVVSGQTSGARLYALERPSRDAAEDATIVFEQRTGRLAGIVVGSALGRWRTAALGGVAARRLTTTRGGRAVVFGTGGQAEAAIWALSESVAPRRIDIVSREVARARAFADRVARDLKIDVQAAASPDHSVRFADVIVTATSREAPVFDARASNAELLIHVGAKRRGASEIAPELYRRAALVVTDAPAQLDLNHRGSVLDEAGIAAGAVASLGQILHRPPIDGLKIFHSLGRAGSEVHLAALLLARIPPQRRPTDNMKEMPSEHA